jgi:hypothetical protein
VGFRFSFFLGAPGAFSFEKNSTRTCVEFISKNLNYLDGDWDLLYLCNTSIFRCKI